MKNTQVTPTRERVMRLIKREGQVSVKTLTEEIGITPMAIRGHLNKLEKDDLIHVDTVRQKLGRPLQVFSLTEKGDSFFPQDYGNFAVELLQDLKEMDDGKTLSLVMQRREDRIFADLEKRMSHLDLDQRMEEYNQFVDSHGHMPILEKTADKRYVLSINNCSLKAVVERFPVCCDSEVSLIHRLFPDATVSKVQSLRNQDKSCCYEFIFA